MRRGTSLGVGILLGALGVLALAPGCGGKSIVRRDATTDDAGGGGSAGTAGATNIAGTAGWSGTAGTSGTGTVSPTGGAGGAGITGGSGGTPNCGPIDGPLAKPSARSTIPFSLTVGGAGGEGGHAALDDDELALSGSGGVGVDGRCEPIADGYECIGTARTMKRGVELSFEFEDGSMLEWTAVGTTYVAPPQVTHGDLVFIEYEQRRPAVCPLCTSDTLTSLRVWSGGQEQVLWFGREGSSIPEVDPGYVTSLFRVPYRLSRSCVMEPFRVDCYTAVTRVLYDHVLETTPEQWIPHATLTRVVTRGGTYDVVWASSELTVVRDANCDDGRLPAQDRGFAASRLDPAPW